MTLLVGIAIGAYLAFRNSPATFRYDSEKIKFLAGSSQSSGTRVLRVYGTDPRGKSFQVPANEFRDILLMLAPVNDGSRQDVMRFPEYEFLFQTGMDPTVIYVREYTPVSLEFEIRGIIYTGGNGLEFKRRIDALINPSSVNSADPTPDSASESN